MRVISGNIKGKKLLLPEPSKTRPLKDSVKENIFNILLHNRDFRVNFENQTAIDFFAGSGSFGIECLSRGMTHVTFVEESNLVKNTLFRNLSNNFEKSKFEIKNKNFFEIDVLPFIKNIMPSIIFFDPPYKIKKLSSIFEIINSIKIRDTIIILHIEKNINFDFTHFRKSLSRVYGLSKIIFLKN